jgi:hypothetical protein
MDRTMSTSRERWATSEANRLIRDRVYWVLRVAGPMTDVQLERHPDFRNDGFGYSTLRARRKELVDLGLVRACGSEKKGGRSFMIWGVPDIPRRRTRSA